MASASAGERGLRRLGLTPAQARARGLHPLDSIALPLVLWPGRLSPLRANRSAGQFRSAPQTAANGRCRSQVRNARPSPMLDPFRVPKGSSRHIPASFRSMNPRAFVTTWSRCAGFRQPPHFHPTLAQPPRLAVWPTTSTLGLLLDYHAWTVIPAADHWHRPLPHPSRFAVPLITQRLTRLHYFNHLPPTPERQTHTRPIE